MKHLILVVGLIFVFAVSGLAQAPIDVLIVDETEGFLESLAVNLIVGLLRQQTDLFSTVDAIISPVASRFDLPFTENLVDQRYDLVVVAPKGALELGEIWLLTLPFPQSRPDLAAAIGFLQGLAAQFGEQFNVEIRLIDINEDLFLGILAGFLTRLGVL